VAYRGAGVRIFNLTWLLSSPYRDYNIWHLQSIRQTTLNQVAFATKCSRGFWAFFRLFAFAPGYTEEYQNYDSWGWVLQAYNDAEYMYQL